MSAIIIETERGMKVQAAPSWPGGYGFGTLGTRADEMKDEAWRMVQRAGITRLVDRASATVISTDMHATRYVQYDLVNDPVAVIGNDERLNRAFLRACR